MVVDPGARVVVTGATGFVGRHVLHVLEQRGIPFVAVGGVRCQGICAGRNEYCALDLLSDDAPKKLIGLGGTHLIHLAWYAEHKHFWTSPKNFDWALATVALVRAFALSGRHVTAIGTCAEYDWSSGLCIEEDTPLEPSTIYGHAKVATASLTQSACALSGVSLCWARLFLPFGPGEHPDRFVPSVAEALSGRRPKFSVGNENWRDFLAIEDVADAIVHLTLTEYQGTINICSGTPRQVCDLVAEIGCLVGASDCALPDNPATVEGGPRWIIGDDSRLRATGWRPKTSFSRRLAAYVGQLGASSN